MDIDQMSKTQLSEMVELHKTSEQAMERRAKLAKVATGFGLVAIMIIVFYIS